jgi:hypothetical protein
MQKVLPKNKDSRLVLLTLRKHLKLDTIKRLAISQPTAQCSIMCKMYHRYSSGYCKVFNKIGAAQESDTTDVDSSTAAGNKNINLINKSTGAFA